MTKIREEDKKLLQASVKAMNNAYVLWGCRVGAAVLAEDGEIYTGCNIESWISGLGVCAERCAIHHAVLHDNRKIKRIGIVTEAHNQFSPQPCGACLQYIYDFAENPETKIVTAKTENSRILLETVEVSTITQLLPHPFRKQTKTGGKHG